MLFISFILHWIYQIELIKSKLKNKYQRLIILPFAKAHSYNYKTVFFQNIIGIIWLYVFVKYPPKKELDLQKQKKWVLIANRIWFVGSMSKPILAFWKVNYSWSLQAESNKLRFTA